MHRTVSTRRNCGRSGLGNTINVAAEENTTFFFSSMRDFDNFDHVMRLATASAAPQQAAHTTAIGL
jgi:hypothetical protein